MNVDAIRRIISCAPKDRVELIEIGNQEFTHAMSVVWRGRHIAPRMVGLTCDTRHEQPEEAPKPKVAPWHEARKVRFRRTVVRVGDGPLLVSVGVAYYQLAFILSVEPRFPKLKYRWVHGIYRPESGGPTKYQSVWAIGEGDAIVAGVGEFQYRGETIPVDGIPALWQAIDALRWNLNEGK